MTPAILTVPILILSCSAASAAAVCVSNGADHPLLFASEARDGERVLRLLEPGGTLCSESPGDAGGVVSVYESADAFEGCSRLVPAGGKETLLKYAEFDRCAWASHVEAGQRADQ